MKIEDGILENVREIRSPGYENAVWSVNLIPSFIFESLKRPNFWVRLMVFIVFGARWKKIKASNEKT